jgi:hypothetical protein
VKLSVLFAAAFLTVFLGALAYNTFAAPGLEEYGSDESPSSTTAVMPIEPKIESDLAKVLAFEPIPNPPEIKDPFSDKGGISSNAKTAQGNFAQANLPTVSLPSPVKNSGGGNGDGASDRRIIIPGREALAANSPQQNFQLVSGDKQEKPINSLASPEATKERIRLREERLRAGQDGGPPSSVFSVDDLLPVGIVSGGNEQLEVIVYSQAMAQTYSFPIGTRFLDGWLVEWKPEGVGFAHANENGAVYLKTWARSVKQPNS